MSEHITELTWTLESTGFGYKEYNREHEVRFAGGQALRTSAAVEFLGKAECANPEEMLVAALSSCHMLTFLAMASKRGLVVERYEDRAVGTLEKNEHGKLAVTKTVLHPKVIFRGTEPDTETLRRVHDAAHRECFIANSVLTVVTVE